MAASLADAAAERQPRPDRREPWPGAARRRVYVSLAVGGGLGLATFAVGRGGVALGLRLRVGIALARARRELAVGSAARHRRAVGALLRLFGAGTFATTVGLFRVVLGVTGRAREQRERERDCWLLHGPRTTAGFPGFRRL